MSALSSSIESLFKRSLKAAESFKDYNFQQYFVSHVKDDFEQIRATKNEEDIKAALLQQETNAEVLERQSLINSMYTKGQNVAKH
ncbi:hypothetical protein J8273_6949 [Carpediemonas membranifera]|uniref:Uncharacterized protein n=1 Tax=Carpediemonas membranifera TaxID=201153 RepID=A0A8J6AYZ9_9EUKA|nr:hypothetical protein J8273_6949 [Carpediemonas membranifera]|eukprot:KAG9390709.1 hypothetical protein J8273_6949 [Carpediemonas membranifera]